MQPHNKEFIDANFHHFLVMERAFYLRGLDGATRSRMEAIVREEWQPGYRADLNCPQCVFEMVKKLYHHYRDWLRQVTGWNGEAKDVTEAIQIMQKIYSDAISTI